jgi:hypothetical protein
MAQPAWKNAVGRFYGQGVGLPANVWNVAALLNASGPGHCFVDNVHGRVYYTPRAGENMSDPFGTPAVTTSLEQLLTLTGTQAVSFEGIAFAFATWLQPNGGEGYVAQQSGFLLLGFNQSIDDNSWVPVPGNINLWGAQDVALTNCTFSHFGATALVIANSSQRVTVAGSTFADVSCGGARVGQVRL